MLSLSKFDWVLLGIVFLVTISVFLLSDIYPPISIINEDEVIDQFEIFKTNYRKVLSEAPEIGKIVSKDPFFKEFTNDNDIKCHKPSKWSGESMCLLNRSYDTADTIIWLHPSTPTQPRRIKQNVSLQGGEYYLHFGVTNVADEKILTEGCTNNCEDSVVRILVKAKNDTETIFFGVVTGTDPIMNKVVNITDFENENITIIAEGHGGGYCNPWCGESTAISNFFVYTPAT